MHDIPKNWRDLSDGEIIDLMGVLGVEHKRLDDLKKDMCETLLERGYRGGLGTYFQGNYVTSYTQTRLDRAQLETDLGEAKLRKYLKFSSVKATIKVQPRADAAAAAMAAE